MAAGTNPRVTQTKKNRMFCSLLDPDDTTMNRLFAALDAFSQVHHAGILSGAIQVLHQPWLLSGRWVNDHDRLR
jgi:hypothetical protein